jgi:hypothetical protein
MGGLIMNPETKSKRYIIKRDSSSKKITEWWPSIDYKNDMLFICGMYTHIFLNKCDFDIDNPSSSEWADSVKKINSSYEWAEVDVCLINNKAKIVTDWQMVPELSFDEIENDYYKNINDNTKELSAKTIEIF